MFSFTSGAQAYSMKIVTDAGLFNESSKAPVRRGEVTQGRWARGFVAIGLLAISAASCVSDRGAVPDSLSAPEFSAPTPTVQNPKSNTTPLTSL